MNKDVLDTVRRKIEGCRQFSEVFGVLVGDKISQRGQLRKSFAKLAGLVHPDHAPDALRARADEVFRALNVLRHAADEAVKAGSYDFVRSAATRADTAAYSEIQSKKGTYRIHTDQFQSGDFAFLYRGKSDAGPIIAKIALEPSCNAWLENEAKILTALSSAAPTIKALKPWMPDLVDTFVMVHGGKHFRVNIMKAVPDLVSVADIISAYPKGLEAPQAAWVARRIIAQASAAQMLGLVHCSITPDHVLVDPYKHEPLHIGWVHALQDPSKSGERITLVVDRWRDIYPPEVFDKKKPDHRTDIYMAGATIVKLLGGNVTKRSLPSSVPETMAQITLCAIENSPARRPKDSVQYLDEYTRVVRGIWGVKYRPLTMPVR